MRAVPQILLAALLAAPLGAATDPAHWCGTEPAGLEVAHARHLYFERLRGREPRSGKAPPKSHAAVRQAGDIAVVEDDGTLFIAPRRFDLQERAVQFLRRPKGVSAVRSNLDFKSTLGTRLALGDDDAVFVEFPEGFRYPFGDEVWDDVYVNSDGTFTFGAPDVATTPRSLARFLDGPPRIAPLFTDLDPSAAGGEGGLYLNFLPGRVRLTWLEVPEFGTGNRNSVQVTLFTTGRVTFVYGADVEAGEAIVGVNPFGGGAPLHLMDYDAELPFRPERVAIAEWFPAESPQVDDIAIAWRFYQRFRNVYDQLVVWYDFPKSLGTGVLGQALLLSNGVRGIGVDVEDFSDLLGTPRRLQGFVQMAGDVTDHPDDPDEKVLRAGESIIGLTAHEVGHRWLARLRFVDPRTGGTLTRLLGRQQTHWSFFMDSDASVMEGNEIEDQGDGSFLTLAPVAVRYSALDQYAMGLIPPQAVPGFFYVSPTASGIDVGTNPRPGVRFEGIRNDLTIDDVIAAEGERVPPSSEAPKVFRVAFVLVGAPGEEVSQEAIDKLETYRKRFQSFFFEATGANGKVTTKLVSR